MTTQEKLIEELGEDKFIDVVCMFGLVCDAFKDLGFDVDESGMYQAYKQIKEMIDES